MAYCNCRYLKNPHYKCYFNEPTAAIHRRCASGIYVAATVAARRAALHLTADHISLLITTSTYVPNFCTLPLDSDIVAAEHAYLNVFSCVAFLLYKLKLGEKMTNMIHISLTRDSEP
jgi:hypothetical protein